MSKKVGIPRGLFYYKYYPLWKTFFEEIGAEIVVSDYTNKKILDDGVKSCVDEACLPVKLFHGHVINLRDRVDLIFIPRFTSVSKKEYICPKFGGLPDMVRHTITNLPPIIDTEINMWKSGSGAYKAAMQVGSVFNSNRSDIRKAYDKALESYRSYKQQIRDGALPCDILDCKKNKIRQAGSREESAGGEQYVAERLNIAVIGHVYNIYDSFASMNLVQKLRSNGADIITVEMVDDGIIYEKSNKLAKKMFWNFGTKAFGSALHLLDRKDIHGIIYVMSFGCGIDSFVGDLIERHVRRSGKMPFIVFTIDEHSGEAGINTRIEAFMDMIRFNLSGSTQHAVKNNQKVELMEGWV